MAEVQFRLSIDAAQIIERMGALSPGEHVTYAELSKLVGRDVQLQGRYLLTTAMRHHLRKGVVLAPLRGVGIKRLEDVELVGVGDSTLRKIGRCGRRGAHKLAAFVNFDSLGQEDKTRVMAIQSSLGAVVMFSKPSTIKRLQTGVATSMKALAFGNVLKLFGGEEK